MKTPYAKDPINVLARLKTLIESREPSVASRIAAELLRGIKKLKSFPSRGLAQQRK
jgi:hypothetical protein